MKLWRKSLSILLSVVMLVGAANSQTTDDKLKNVVPKKAKANDW